jgi:hypothetical protein
VQYLYRRNGAFDFRLRLPQDLSAKFRLRELRFSLETRDFRTARLRAAAGRTAMERLIFDLRHMDDESEDGPTLILTNGEIRQLARIYYEQQIEQDQNLRVHAGALGIDFAKIQATRPTEESCLRQAIGRGDIAAVKDLATDLVEANPPRASSVPFSVDGASINELCFMILRGKLAANLVAQAHDKGEVNAATTDTLFLDVPEMVSAGSRGKGGSKAGPQSAREVSKRVPRPSTGSLPQGT